MQQISRLKETFLMIGMKFGSPTQFSEHSSIPPASPLFTGLWEASIKSMSHILSKVTKSAVMKFEEFTTFITQIEAVLNSRPLSPLSLDANVFNHLIPRHFLTGNLILSFPEPYIASDSLSNNFRWKLIQNL
ncbi:integrase catalytic domain-containing protein [Trichonephila clavata]|uniref:Integrase catalytic domain-containing protein n=1 Tax=Trichonephila clavata TaxID=2740835 RepID=A0A8X6G6K0_TRICU|nr:integrase catalytic domain-containing protein [Trichonephila clavata]